MGIHGRFTLGPQICPSVLLTHYQARQVAFHETSIAIHDRFTAGANITPRSSLSFQPHNFSEGTMDSSKDKGRNELTPEQKAKVRPATEKDAKAVELSVEELEERIAPRTIY
jgi:hypothetical protein